LIGGVVGSVGSFVVSGHLMIRCLFVGSLYSIYWINIISIFRLGKYGFGKYK
jgi:hypothetical protein